MSTLLAIDPGNEQSAYALIDSDTLHPLRIGKIANEDLAKLLERRQVTATEAVIEEVTSYGMPVGREVFRTCEWIGTYWYILERIQRIPAVRLARRDVKLHHCGSSRANDGNIRQALVDRFTPGRPNHGKGTKTNPGWFYGFKADIWQAYALAVCQADQMAGRW